MQPELDLMTQKQLADCLRISTKTLEAMRQRGGGPKYHKFGGRVLYSRASIAAYLAQHEYSSTSDYETH